MLRRLLLVVIIPPLLVGVAALVLIGLRDLDLLVALVSRLMSVAVIIGTTVMMIRIILFPRRSRNERR